MDMKCEINIKNEPLEGMEYSEAHDQIYVMTGLQELQVESCDLVIDIKNEFEIKDGMEESKNEETFNQITEVDEKQDLYIGDVYNGKSNRNRYSGIRDQELIEEEKTTSIQNRKEFSCLNCNVNFESEDELANHLKSICERKVKCSQSSCDDNCESNLKPDLLNHKNQEESVPKRKLFKCSECNYECNHKGHLNRHLLTHGNIKLFRCPECDYEGIHKESLKIHLLTHANIKLFKCSECNYECNQKRDLQIHMLKHRNIKLFKCPECNFECKRKGNLKTHLLTHGNTKLFKCTECNYECNHKGHLKRHLLTHGNIKLFKCPECDYESNHKESFKIHLLIHANLKLFECSECYYECNQKRDLQIHMLKHRSTKLLKSATTNVNEKET